MKKVLMIAHHFPPIGGVGTFRITKFVKYLPKFGWKPIVLTVQTNCYSNNAWIDVGFKKNIPKDIHVYRTKTLRSKIINDEGIRWLPFLIPKLISLIKKEKPDLVFITGGPFFPLIVCPIIKIFYRLHCVVDLRDPWKLLYNKIPIQGLKAHLGRFLINIAEPIVLRNASKVICASNTLQKEYQSVYTNQKEKFLTITNGYDPDDFDNTKPKKYERFTIVYTGKFRCSEALLDPTPIFRALKILHGKGVNIQFVHVGLREEEIVTLSRKIGIQNFIKFIGPKSYAETLQYAKGADLLLVIGSNKKMGLSVKIFDYIGCHRPILILTDKDGELWKVGKKISFATLLENIDPDNIAHAIEEIHQNCHKIEWAKNMGSKYHRRNLTSILSEVFNEVLLTKEKNKGNASQLKNMKKNISENDKKE